MRIVAYSNFYMPRCRAGSLTTLRDLLRPLVARHEVVIVVHDGRGEEDPYTWEGIPVLPDSRVGRWSHVVESADLIITQLGATESAAQIAEANDIPVIQLIHSDHPDNFDFLKRRHDLLVFNTASLRSAFPDVTGPSLVVHPPIAPDDYRTTPGDSVTLVTLCPLKGSRVFYAVAEALPDVRFSGVRGDDDYGPDLERDIRQLDNVEVVETVNDIRPVFGRTRVLLMPSMIESFGRVGIEAAASGIPTIATPTPGLREALGYAGTFCHYDDLDAWTAAVTRMRDEDEWLTASRRAQARSAELALIARRQLATWCEAVESFTPDRPALKPPTSALSQPGLDDEPEYSRRP